MASEGPGGAVRPERIQSSVTPQRRHISSVFLVRRRPRLDSRPCCRLSRNRDTRPWAGPRHFERKSPGRQPQSIPIGAQRKGSQAVGGPLARPRRQQRTVPAQHTGPPRRHAAARFGSVGSAASVVNLPGCVSAAISLPLQLLEHVQDQVVLGRAVFSGVGFETVLAGGDVLQLPQQGYQVAVDAEGGRILAQRR